MAESSRSWNESEAICVTSGDIKEKLDSHLQLAKKCVEVHKLSTPKFNNEQCSYLVNKLKVAVEIAIEFLEWSQVQPRGPCINMHIARQAKNLELLVALAKEIESFVQSCSKNTWMESALTLAHAAKYVSSLGFNLELCNIAFCCGQTTPRSLTIDEVCKISKDEVETVVKKASRDKDTLLKNVTFELNSSNAKDCSLAKHLVHQLVEVQPKPTSDDDSFLLRMFEWVVWGKKTKQLGRGSSATVEKVKWFGLPAAKKTFDGPENGYFFKEVEILSQLRHPNITSMFCCHMDKWSCSIIMELMDGDLRNMMVKRQKERNNDAPPFTILEGVDLMLQVGEGVNYLHDKRIVHRDLKSSNILVKNVEVSSLGLGYVQAKVVDFGLSKTKEKSTYSTMTCNMGTYRWMAPEMINVTKADEESIVASEKLPKHVFKVDIYSFAMVCFEILTGELPFSSTSLPTIVKEMVLKGERPEIPDYCPQMLKYLIEKCWSQIPSERPCISDVCLQLKYIKYLLMTGNNFVDACESMVTNIVPTKMDCGPNEIFVVHQLHPQVGDISTSIRATLIFFHGFHKGPEEWSRTWMTRDNKLVWPQEWLPEDLGTKYLRVLSVSFGENTTVNNLQEMAKNLVYSLVLSHEWKLGESGEAIFLIGHSFGGVLINNLVTEARHVVQNNRGEQEAQKCEKFLERLGKIVFYSVPHADFENYISECKKIVAIRESPFLQSLAGDSQFVADMNKLSAEFKNAIPEKLKILAFFEGKAMSKGCVVVTENSFGRASEDCQDLHLEWHKIDEDNHFEVCQPNSKNHTGYRILLQHLHRHLNDPYGVTSTLDSDYTRVLGKRQSDGLSTASEAFPTKNCLSFREEGSSTSAIVSVTHDHSTLPIIDSVTPNDFSRWTVIDETKRREKEEREKLSEAVKVLACSTGAYPFETVQEPQIPTSVMETVQEPRVPAHDGPLNILLLGASGVGKSTFINALCNYLTYPSLDEAVKGELQSLIYCEFQDSNRDSSGHLSTKKIVVGKPDSDEGGANLQAGPSCTQRCKAYTIPLGECGEIRLIDTPGILDTRGVDADTDNMKHILAFLARYEVLHAVCILLRPNEVRLTNSLKYSIVQLLEKLHKDASRNILFCFTNSRNTRYRVGSTLPLLEDMLKDIKFSFDPWDSLSSIYFFDSEAFRYQAIMKQGGDFDEDEFRDYVRSWNKSAAEAERLIGHILTLEPHHLKDTLSLNRVRSMLESIQQPLGKLAADIQDNLQKIKKTRDELQKGRGDVSRYLSKLFTVETYQRTVALDHPQTVCTEKKCEGSVCQEKCSPTETALGLSFPNLSYSSGKCRVCKCPNSKHIREHTKMVPDTRTIMDESILKVLDDTTSTMEKKESILKILEEREEGMEDENKVVVEAAALFAGFLEQNSIVTYHSAISDYYKEEKMKMKREGNLKRAQELDEVLQLYEKRLRFFTVCRVNCADADDSNITEARVNEELQKLYKLKLHGPELKKWMDRIESAAVFEENQARARGETVYKAPVPSFNTAAAGVHDGSRPRGLRERIAQQWSRRPQILK